MYFNGTFVLQCISLCYGARDALMRTQRKGRVTLDK